MELLSDCHGLSIKGPHRHLCGSIGLQLVAQLVGSQGTLGGVA